jgi:hypothetical protein
MFFTKSSVNITVGTINSTKNTPEISVAASARLPCNHPTSLLWTGDIATAMTIAQITGIANGRNI